MTVSQGPAGGGSSGTQSWVSATLPLGSAVTHISFPALEQNVTGGWV